MNSRMKIRKYRLLRLEETSSNFKIILLTQGKPQFRNISEQWFTLLLCESAVYITESPEPHVMEWFPSGFSSFILKG